MLALMYQKYVAIPTNCLQTLHHTTHLSVANRYISSIQSPRLCFTNQDIQMVRLCSPNTMDTKTQLRSPVLTKSSEHVDSLSSGKLPAAGPEGLPPRSDYVSPKGSDGSMAAIASSRVVQDFLQCSLHLAVDDLFSSGTVQQLMESTLNQVTSFDATYRGSYNSEHYDIHKVPISGEGDSTEDTAGKKPTMSRSKVCHQKSSIGVVLGSIWIRTSTLKVEEGSTTSSGQLEIITSFIFYPASWLVKFGFRYGTEASLRWSATTGWKFNVSAVRAVPENSLIFELCRAGNIEAVQLMLSRGDASVKDTSPKGWNPLHVVYPYSVTSMCLYKTTIANLFLVCCCLWPR